MHRHGLLLAGACFLLASAARRVHAQDEQAAIGSFALSIASATAPDGSVLFEPGFGFQLHVPYFEAGMQFEFAEAQVVGGARNATNFVPLIGSHLEWNRDQELIAQPYAQLRLPVQIRSGAGMDNSLGLALGAEIGGRVWACKAHTDYDESEFWQGFCVGASLAVRYQQHLDDFQMGAAVLPQNSGVFTLPVMLNFGFNPRSVR